ncbi:hypothetical protein N8H41_11020 [Pseudomonas vlassakiae]|uniref:hypothetical protein n=1 Tax=Pseudomonas vlassakiae TaxID=485888 RepID=UPI000ED1A2E2|nr:hypothetical protein [Pseudomonas vlassakiae]MCU0124501.1 hypothetical protein [Pseudomonas vlassakiae]HCV37868.1 hypothetical protein [Pseudomonas sp.]
MSETLRQVWAKPTRLAGRLSTVMLFFVLIAGCGPGYSYRYVAPASEAGLACVRACSTELKHCKQLSAEQARSERARYESEHRAYQYCRAGRTKKDARFYCPAPTQFWGGDALMSEGSSCRQGFNDCYVGCGGQVERVTNAY